MSEWRLYGGQVAGLAVDVVGSRAEQKGAQCCDAWGLHPSHEKPMSELRIDKPALIRWIRGNLSQEDVAALCGLQQHATVSYWERGTREPTERQWMILLDIGRRLPPADQPINTWLSITPTEEKA